MVFFSARESHASRLLHILHLLGPAALGSTAVRGHNPAAPAASSRAPLAQSRPPTPTCLRKGRPRYQGGAGNRCSARGVGTSWALRGRDESVKRGWEAAGVILALCSLPLLPRCACPRQCASATEWGPSTTSPNTASSQPLHAALAAGCTLRQQARVDQVGLCEQVCKP